MRYIDEYRDAESAHAYSRALKRITKNSWKIMEVCGGQTHSIVRFGLDEMLPDAIRLIHGPGCPVCVTPLELVCSGFPRSHMPVVAVSVPLGSSIQPLSDSKSSSKTTDVADLLPGDAVSYTIVVQNTGPSDVQGATVRDVFPGDLTNVTYTSVPSGNASGSSSGSGNIDDLVNLAAGSRITYTVNAIGTTPACASGQAAVHNAAY